MPVIQAKNIRECCGKGSRFSARILDRKKDKKSSGGRGEKKLGFKEVNQGEVKGERNDRLLSRKKAYLSEPSSEERGGGSSSVKKTTNQLGKDKGGEAPDHLLSDGTSQGQEGEALPKIGEKRGLRMAEKKKKRKSHFREAKKLEKVTSSPSMEKLSSDLELFRRGEKAAPGGKGESIMKKKK